MKKCKNCGAIQSDDQTVCLDCSVPLGNSMTDAEENAADAVFEKKLNNMAEQTDDFYVPRHDKIMGYACILLIVASIVLMTLAHQAQRTISETLVSEITINDHTVALPDGVAFSVPSQRETQLNEAKGLGLICILASAFACPMLLIPRIMWFLDTLGYRIFHGWDTPRSYYAKVSRKIGTYIIFGIALIALSYGWLLYFM